MIRLFWALSAHARYFLRHYATNIALAANYCITLIEDGGSG